MAMRVRKLAKELRRSPAETLGLIHAVGHPKYRSIEDMVPDALVQKVRMAVRAGICPLPVKLEAKPRSQKARPQQGGDLMAQLVPGVVPLDGRGRARPAQRSEALAPPTPRAERSLPPPPAPLPPPSREVPRASQGADASTGRIHRLEEQRDELLDRCEQLEAERDGWAQAHDRVQAQVDAMQAEVEQLRARFSEARAAMERMRTIDALPSEQLPTVALTELLDRRGLRGADEHQRALSALALTRSWGPLLDALRVRSDSPVERWLEQRLVLVSDPAEVPEVPGQAPVAVAPDRAELPTRAELATLLGQLGEQLLLDGTRRVNLVGGGAVWHRLIRDGLDDRVEVRFPAPRTRSRADAEQDVTRTELVVLWGVGTTPEADAVYETSRARIIRLGNLPLPAMLEAWREAVVSG